MKSKMLIGVLVIALAAAVIGGGTMAWFTDEDVSDPVTFTAGTLMIDIDKFDLVNTGEINLDILNPGDEWGYDVEIKNSGTKNFDYKVGFCWQDILGNTLVDFGVRDGFGTDPLSDVVEFTIYDGDNELVMPTGTLENKNAPLQFEIGRLAPGATDSYRIQAVLPTTADNKYQGSQMRLAFVVMAKQIHEDADYPEFECPLLALFPSTNYLNATGQAPGAANNPAPYVELVEADGNSVTLNFKNPSYWLAVFEYRVDGDKTKTDNPHDGNVYPWLPDDETYYENSVVLNGGVDQEIKIDANNKVEVRMAAGGESDVYFDWTPFYVVK